MKKITFVLVVLLSSFSFNSSAQNESSASAVVHAELVRPIAITKGRNLIFGTIAQMQGGGFVRVAEDGTRTFSNPKMKVPTSRYTPSSASFTLNVPDGYGYGISIPPKTIKNAAQVEIPVSFTHSKSGQTLVGTGENETLLVGGLLDIAGTENPGVYQGTVEVTVTYE